MDDIDVEDSSGEHNEFAPAQFKNHAQIIPNVHNQTLALSDCPGWGTEAGSKCSQEVVYYLSQSRIVHQDRAGNH